MKKLKLIIVAGGLSLGGTVAAWACTTIVVGPEATADGSILIGRNDDTSNALKTFEVMLHPASENAVGSLFRSNANNFSYSLPVTSLAYLALPRSITRDKANRSFEEVGINERGVAVSATETIFNSQAVLNLDPYAEESGINEDSIPSVILAAAANAREGVLLLGSIIETQGAAEGFGVVISDNSGSWYLETAGGHRWVATKVPANKYFVAANQGRTQEVNLADGANYIGSSDLITFAEKNNLLPGSGGFWSWFKPSAKPESFNFFKAYVQNDQHDTTYNYPRIESLVQLYSSKSYAGLNGDFPNFESPSHPLTLADVAAGLRQHYLGSVYDPYTTQNPTAPYRPAAVMRAIFSHITQLRPKLPPAIGNVEYIAIGMPDLSIYLPFYQGLAMVPTEYQSARDGKVDDSLAFWKYRKLQALVMQNYPKYAPQVHQQFALFEQSLAIKQAEVEKTYLSFYQKDPQQAANLIQQFNTIIVSQADHLVDSLSKKIAKEQNLDKLTAEDYASLIDKTEKAYHYGGA